MSDARGSVVVVGSISADVTAFSARLPEPGETVLGDGFTLVLGGKGANQAIGAARAGAATSMVGCVGDDLFRDLVLDGLRSQAVDVSGVRTVPGPTGVAHIRVGAGGENDIVVVPLANAHLTPDVAEQALRTAAAGDDPPSVLLLQLEIPLPTAVRAAQVGRELGLTVVLDPAPAPVTPLPEDLWPCVDLVTPNETEVRLLTGLPVGSVADAEVAGRWFVERGVRTAVVTLAGQGAVVVDADGVRHRPAFEVRPVDTTAAGDAFTGALGAALAAGADLEAALLRAAAAGALAVTVAGASPSLPTAEAVDDFLREHAAP